MSDARKKTAKKIISKLGTGLFTFFQGRFEGKTAVQAENRGARIGELLFKFSKKHRERALSNLELAFPEWSAEQRLQVARNTFRHFGMITGDFLRSESRTNQEVVDNMEVHDMEGFQAVAKDGAMLVTGHFGNWERAAQWVNAVGMRIAVVARDADDTGLQKRVLEAREKTGMRVLSRGSAARALISELRAGGIVAVLPDQNANEAFLPFFGQPAGTVLGPAVIGIRTGRPVIPCACVRVGPGKYRIFWDAPLQPLEGYEPAEGIMAAYNLWLEGAIRKYPDQWLWFHDRWKFARRKGLLK